MDAENNAAKGTNYFGAWLIYAENLKYVELRKI